VRLMTILHVSDLHFGPVDPSTFDARAPRLWAKWKHFDGLLGHSYKSLVRLEQIYRRLKANENAQLLISGDLTTVGGQDEFATAHDYLGGLLIPPKGEYLGLQDHAWRDLCVPGNHDHWSGQPVIWGGPTAHFNSYFNYTPRQTFWQLNNGFRLSFLSIDTDSDVSPYGSSRVLARGDFQSHLRRLAAMLGVPPADKREIRVLILHHSYTAQGKTLVMNSASKAALHDFIVDHDISVLLCGHIHQPPSATVVQASHLKQTVQFLEARSGTTTQISSLPYDWTNLLGHRPDRGDHWPNTLLVHRILFDGGALDWQIELLAERPSGFEPFATDWKPFRLWPR